MADPEKVEQVEEDVRRSRRTQGRTRCFQLLLDQEVITQEQVPDLLAEKKESGKTLRKTIMSPDS